MKFTSLIAPAEEDEDEEEEEQHMVPPSVKESPSLHRFPKFNFLFFLFQAAKFDQELSAFKTASSSQTV